MDKDIWTLAEKYRIAKTAGNFSKGMDMRNAEIAAKFQVQNLMIEIAGYERCGGAEYAKNMLERYVEDALCVVAVMERTKHLRESLPNHLTGNKQ